MMQYEEMKALLSTRLKLSRYEHSLGVAETAVFLAERFGVDIMKAKIAGLLHDCAREFSDDKLIQVADKYKINYSEIEKKMPILLHAYISAELAREIYGVEDNEILQAIYNHTVGAENMTKLDKIVYFADMIEPGRSYPEVETLRKLAKEADLDEMLLEGLTQSIIFVASKNQLIHQNTVAARNELLLKE